MRANALTSLQALNQTLSVLDGVTRAVEEAKRDHKHADQIKEVKESTRDVTGLSLCSSCGPPAEFHMLISPVFPSQVAIKAMQAALNATATSTLAMHMTKEALHRSADQETDELINVLNQV